MGLHTGSAWRCRVPYRTAADTSGEVSRVLGKLERSGNDLSVIRALANAPHAFRPIVLLSDSLLHRGSIACRTRELVILAIAGELGAAYEQFEHEPMAARAGVDQTQQERLRGGFNAHVPRLSSEERLALELARELVVERTVSRSMWNAATAAFGHEGALDLVLTVGWWGGFMPAAIAGLGLEPMGGPP